MAVYVDQLMPTIPNANWRYRLGCHLIADSLDELHETADRLGLRRSWFQPTNGNLPHYDLTINKRKQAVRLGAVEIDRRKFVDMLRAHRQCAPGTGKRVTADSKPRAGLRNNN
jgi:hypothetical protein